MRPVYFSWESEDLDDDREYLRDFDHFKSDAHLDVKKKFNDFMDKLMFAPRYMIALTSGMGHRLQKRLWAHYMDSLLDPLETHHNRAENKIVKKYFFIDMNDLIPVLNVKNCEVMSCDAQGAVISPNPEASDDDSDSDSDSDSDDDEPECISFERHSRATFSCFLLPDMDEVSLKTYDEMPLFTPASDTQKDMLENPRKGKKLKLAEAKFVLHFGSCMPVVDRANRLLKSYELDFLSFRAGYTRLWGKKQKLEYLDVFRGLSPLDHDTLSPGKSVGIVFEGRKVFHAYTEIGYEERQDAEGFKAKLESCKTLLKEKGPAGAHLIAFMTANLNASHRKEVKRNVRAFAEVFPGVPIMGNLDHDARWLLSWYPRFKLLIVGFA